MPHPHPIQDTSLLCKAEHPLRNRLQRFDALAYNEFLQTMQQCAKEDHKTLHHLEFHFSPLTSIKDTRGTP
jgi:hypothetical protein